VFALVWVLGKLVATKITMRKGCKSWGCSA